ncbi:MAG: cytochrome c [Thiomonas sp.]
MRFSLLSIIAGCALGLQIQSAFAAQPTPNNPEVLRGAYLASASDCIACHTAPGGKPFAGGLPMNLPMDIGKVYSPNITPDKQDGIGNWTFEQFDEAVRHGVSPRLGRLYPAMPYPSYARITPEDMHALYAYFMQGVQPVAQANKAEDIPWPLNMRWPLAIWDRMFANQTVYTPDPKQTVEWNRGAYLVEGPGHCSACHTPRGPFLQEKAMEPGGPNGSLYLSGARIDNWYAANLRGDMSDGLGRWSTAQLVQLLKTGRTADFTIVGSMADVIKNSTQHLNDGDLQAIAVFLKSLPPVRPNSAINKPQAPLMTASAKAGEPLYTAHCAMCHQAQGQGIPNVFPAVALNPTVNTPDPINFIRMMLQGGHTVETKDNPTPMAMPDLGATLNDTQVAEIASYVRSSWGNDAPNVSTGEVTKIRKITAKK